MGTVDLQALTDCGTMSTDMGGHEIELYEAAGSVLAVVRGSDRSVLRCFFVDGDSVKEVDWARARSWLLEHGYWSAARFVTNAQGVNS